MRVNGTALREQSLPEVIRALAQEDSTLLHQEVALAKAELGQGVTQLKEMAPETAALARRDLELARKELPPKARSISVGVGAFVGAATTSASSV